MSQIGDVIENKYEILKEIGKGGMSVVYLAMDKRLNKQWAVKEIQKVIDGKSNEVIVKSLLAEANLMKRLDHPALPRIVDIIDNGETIYIIMDYIEGEPLDKVVNEYGAQQQELVIEWAKQLCDVLTYLHNQNPAIIYRDMKPANIMLKPEGNLKLIDFGIAREYKVDNVSDTQNLGTRGYAAPEQFGGRGQTDPRTDIYCLGTTLFHLVTGQHPSNIEVYGTYEIRQWNPLLSRGLESIIRKCTQQAPSDRYQSCEELRIALNDPEKNVEDFLRKQKKKLKAYVALGVCCLLMVLSGILCSVIANGMNSRSYDTLVSIADSTEYKDKISSYKEATEIFPYDTRAYRRMLEAYRGEGIFSKEQNDEFLALYNKYKEGFDQDSVEVAELNYQIGMMYFNYYTKEDGSYSFSERVQKAYSFFTLNYENAPEEFESIGISNSYYQICSFYKKYILSATNIDEASKDNYIQLLTTIEEAMEQIKVAGAYNQLSLYNGIFLLLYDQRTNMAQVGVEKEVVLQLFENAYRNANDLNVQKEQSRVLQSEIIENYQAYKNGIERAYTNKEERQ